MNPVGIGVITKLPYKLIEIQAVFNIVEDFCIAYFPKNVSIQIQSATLAMLRGITTANGTVELRGPVSRRDVDRDSKVISDRLKDMLS